MKTRISNTGRSTLHLLAAAGVALAACSPAAAACVKCFVECVAGDGGCWDTWPGGSLGRKLCVSHCVDDHLRDNGLLIAFDPGSTGYTEDEGLAHLDWSAGGAAFVIVQVDQTPEFLPIERIDLHLVHEAFNEEEPFGTLIGSVQAFGAPTGHFQIDFDSTPYAQTDGAVLSVIHYQGVNEPEHAGAIYLGHLSPLCYPDFNQDAQLDLFDFLGFVNAFNAGDQGTDCTADGALDLFDFLCFVNAFNNGC